MLTWITTALVAATVLTSITKSCKKWTDISREDREINFEKNFKTYRKQPEFSSINRWTPNERNEKCGLWLLLDWPPRHWQLSLWKATGNKCPEHSRLPGDNPSLQNNKPRRLIWFLQLCWWELLLPCLLCRTDRKPWWAENIFGKKWKLPLNKGTEKWCWQFLDVPLPSDWWQMWWKRRWTDELKTKKRERRWNYADYCELCAGCSLPGPGHYPGLTKCIPAIAGK